MSPLRTSETFQALPPFKKPDPGIEAATEAVIEAGVIAGQERILKGSQAKTAYALRVNAEQMCHEADSAPKRNDGINCIGFLTLTVGEKDEKTGKFRQVWDAKDASDRINNLNRRLLPEIFEKAIVVTERHRNGAIHFHILGIVRGRIDIRSGFDFKAFGAAVAARNRHRIDTAAEKRYKRAASEELREMWATLRKRLPKLGFGRAELTPIRETGEQVSSYVSKYIEKNVCERRADDKHKKLVRYVGWGKDFKCSDREAVMGVKVDGTKARPVGRQLKANEFGWGSASAVAWHAKARDLGALLGAKNQEELAEALGPRWAWHVSGLMLNFPGAKTPCMIWTYPERELCRRELGRLNQTFVRRHYEGKIGPDRFQAWLKAAERMDREDEREWQAILDVTFAQFRREERKPLIINDAETLERIEEEIALQQSRDAELLQSVDDVGDLFGQN